MSFQKSRLIVKAAAASVSFLCAAIVAAQEPELVNLRSVDPTIVVELRYAGVRNIAQRPLYPANMAAFVRPAVARKLAIAQSYLRERGYGLKIWDAYRPKSAHDQLWQYSRNKDYVADPADGLGSLHTWGVAVDATLVDKDGREVEMPTDFDSFTAEAMLHYNGSNEAVRRNVRRLQTAMAKGGFYGLRTEWWHFVAKDWKTYQAIPEIAIVPRSITAAGAAPAAGKATSAGH
ncbi:MAG: M15 family metallopeptidase [Chthoniobacterales bacterium]